MNYKIIDASITESRNAVREIANSLDKHRQYLAEERKLVAADLRTIDGAEECLNEAYRSLINTLAPLEEARLKIAKLRPYGHREPL